MVSASACELGGPQLLEQLEVLANVHLEQLQGKPSFPKSFLVAPWNHPVLAYFQIKPGYVGLFGRTTIHPLSCIG